MCGSFGVGGDVYGVAVAAGRVDYAVGELRQVWGGQCWYGECDETGLCYIATEPRYRETVSETQDLRWALTPTGASAALWAEKTAFGAIVHGPAGQCFDWVCWGVQRGFEGVYADVSDAKYPEEENRGAALLDAAETEAAVSLPLTIEEAS